METTEGTTRHRCTTCPHFEVKVVMVHNPDTVEKVIEPRNRSNPIIRVAHTDLERYDESPYRSKCPTCRNGILLIHRNITDFTLQRLDLCISCGQRVYYTDDKICGEAFEELFL